MKLSDLFLNRWLYRESKQNLETKDAVYDSSNVIPASVAPVASGGAAQDINTSNVTINGGNITPGTIPPDVLDVSNWGWGQTLVFSSSNLNTVIWTATAPNNNTFKSANGVTYTIASGTTGVMAAKTYIYLDLNVSNAAYQITTNPALAVGIGKVLIAVAQNAAVSATYALSEATQIVGDNIIANTINASKMNVGQLSAISADLGTMTAGSVYSGLFSTGTPTSSASRMIIENVNNTITFYNASNAIVSQLGGGTNVGFGLRIYNDASTTDGVYVSSSVAGVGFRYVNDGNVTNNGLVIQMNGTTNNSNPSIQIVRAGSGEGIYIDNNGTDQAILIDNASTASYALEIINAAANPSIYITDSGSSNAINITKSGTGDGIYISHSTNGYAANFYHNNNSTAFNITHDGNTNNPTALITKNSVGTILNLTTVVNSSTQCSGIEFNINNAGSGLEHAFDFEGAESGITSSGNSGFVSNSTGTFTVTGYVRVRVGGASRYMPYGTIA